MSKDQPISPAVMARRRAEKPAAARTAAPEPQASAADSVGPERMTGSQAIIRSLEHLGVTDVFGLPGGAILPTYDPLLDAEKINHTNHRDNRTALIHSIAAYCVGSRDIWTHQRGHPARRWPLLRSVE